MRPVRPPRTAPPRLPAARTRGAALAVLALGASFAACGHDPVGPAASSYRPSTPIAGSVARASYGDTLLAWEHDVFYWGDRVDWTRQAAAVRARVATATTHGDLWAAADSSIDPWLVDAPPAGRDLHSAFFPPSVAPGLVDSPVDTTRRYLVVGDTLPRTLAPGAGRVAYLWFPHYSGRTPRGRVDSAQAVIRTVDAQGPCGWVLDQRANYGGDIAAMFAALNPLIGDAPASATQNGAGGFVFADSSRVLLYLQGGEVGSFDPATGRRAAYDVRPTTNYVQRRPNTPVAILVGPMTASAGELITLAFRGGPVPYRTFGASTYGITTGPVGRYLRPDSGFLNITASIMFDRLGRSYGGVLVPDEPVAGPEWRALTPGGVLRNGDPVVAAAVRWLQAQPSCTGAPLAARAVAAARAPAAPVRLPGVVKASPVHEWLSRYFLPPAAAPTRPVR